MSNRERWTVYPLLFLTLGIALKDKITKRTDTDTVICKNLVVTDRQGAQQVIVSSNPAGGIVQAPILGDLESGRTVLGVHAAAHRNHSLGAVDHRLVDTLWHVTCEADTVFEHDLGHNRIDCGPRNRPRRLGGDVNAATPSEVVNEGFRHLGTTRVMDADEQKLHPAQHIDWPSVQQGADCCVSPSQHAVSRRSTSVSARSA